MEKIIETVVLENEDCLVEISREAAEIHRLIDKATGIEAIWSGDPKYWANRNPILFPHVGSLPNQTAVLKGKIVHSGNHGFARHARFEWGAIDRCSAELILRNDDERKQQEYPYDFELRVVYRLMKKRLELTYTVINADSDALPFEIGLHPAFNVPLVSGQRFEDYRIEFEVAEKSAAQTKSGAVYALDGKTLDFADHPFSLSKALFFEGLKSRYCTLTDGAFGVCVGIENMERVGFWRPSPDAPFVCIEPWLPRNMLKREDTFGRGKENWLLPSGESFSFGTYYEIL